MLGLSSKSTLVRRWWVILVLLTLSCGNGFVNYPLSLNGRTLVPYGGVRRVTDSVRGHGVRLSMLHTPSMGEVDHGALFAQLIGERWMYMLVHVEWLYCSGMVL